MALYAVYFCVLFALTQELVVAQDYDFTHQVLLDGSSDFWLQWSFTADTIDIQASAKTLGWLAFGFSKDGGMDKSDVMFAYVNDTTGRANISDRYLRADGTNVQLFLDAQQDWELLTASKNGSHTSVRVRRKLETCDPLDYPITKDTMRVIFSLDQQPPTDFLHPAMHEFRGEKSVLFLDPALAVRKLGLPVGGPVTMEWNVLMDGVIIPESVTSRFQCKLDKIPAFTQTLHIMKVEPRIDPENIDLVRQIIVYICSKDVTDDYQPKDFVCGIDHPGDRNSPEQTALFGNCTTVLAAWAIGASPFVYPDDVGYPIGPELSGSYVLIQTQYVNGPMQRRVDSSGLKFGLTDKLRKNEAGILSIGLTGNAIIPPNTADFTLSGLCAEFCTKQGLPDDGITVFGGSFHTNGLGSKFKLRQIRDRIELPPLTQDSSFDPLYQENRGIDPNRKMQKGDQLSLECTYSTTDPTSPRHSTASTDELCFGALLYYPRINMTSCHSTYYVPDYDHPRMYMNEEPHWNDTLIPGNDTLSASNDTLTASNDTVFQNSSLPAIQNISVPVVTDAPTENANYTMITVTDAPSDMSANYTWTMDKIAALQRTYNSSQTEMLAFCSFASGNSSSVTMDQFANLNIFIPVAAPNATCPVLTAPTNPFGNNVPLSAPHVQGSAVSSGKSVKRPGLLVISYVTLFCGCLLMVLSV